MVDRRTTDRPDSGDRRTFPRPPLWLNLTLLLIAVATFVWARQHRANNEAKTAALFQPTQNSPEELNRIRDELSRLDLTGKQLSAELDARLKYLESLEGEEFYISIDTSSRKFQFRFGGEVVREADVQIGESKTIRSKDGKKQWTFVPLKGAFNVVEKSYGDDWRVPEWFYAMNNETPPAERPVIEDGLGRYVIALPNNYIIHSPPPEESPLDGAKPGSFLVPEDVLGAIWPRITQQTRVYIF